MLAWRVFARAERKGTRCSSTTRARQESESHDRQLDIATCVRESGYFIIGILMVTMMLMTDDHHHSHRHRVISQETPDTDGDGFEDEDEAMLETLRVFAAGCSLLPGI